MKVGDHHRAFFRTAVLTVTSIAWMASALALERPNVIVIMSDDQGVGDYGFMGNEVIKTPELDALVQRSALMNRFYVSPVCAPTRASLMTGRYNYRTRCIDTYVGRAMMDPAEVTIAELLHNAGYQTGIYGKWHLGDSYPLRPMDQGFQDCLVHRGGGIGQPSDPIGAEGKYTDPTLFKNGVETPMKGYCTDIYFDAAMSFIESAVAEQNHFFAYIATNAPHGPFHDVPKELYQSYLTADFGPILVKDLPPKRLSAEVDKLARIAAMITNIDENVGRLLRKLDELKIRENTIVIYLNDNGPNTLRYVGDMRGMKTHVDDGGVRSPLVFHWPTAIAAPVERDELCAHIDLLPTLMDACQVDLPSDLQIDGRSFLPLLMDDEADWPKRQVVIQAHRGDVPQRYHHFSLHEAPWKLVHPSGFGKETFSGPPKLELYNLHEDPRQQRDVSDEFPEVKARLQEAYEAWFADVSTTRPNNYAPPRIVIGTDHEPTTVLTRQDWRHTKGRAWAADSNGHWLLESMKPGTYDVELVFADSPSSGQATVRAGNYAKTLTIEPGNRRGHKIRMDLPGGKFSFSVDVVFWDTTQGPHQVIVQRIGSP
ncbi:sulfatase-like hydrolase/transferase [Crateriforma spongiae]|uniref:sulfatase-like hydrolase/transferase n=1 Tax=Crateriforma spongiae TaxID=2724528 RepID=UPI0039AEE92A